jgi:alkylation response protein AidB-like acyl-CoA dehydrogenase
MHVAGSDVSNLTTTAEKSKDGNSYTINGDKKWVTQGMWATHALVGCRTGPPGSKGLSVFIVDLNQKGIERRKMENSGVSSSGET